MSNTNQNGNSLWRTREFFELTDCPYTPPPRLSPLILPEKTDVRLMGAVTQATGLLAGGFEFYLRTL